MRTIRLLACSVIVVLAAAGCAGPAVDGVLWRQIAAIKDPLTRALVEPRDQTAGELAEDLRHGDGPVPALFWDGAAELDEGQLGSSGAVVWDVQSRSNAVSFSVMVHSGPRDAAADPFADPDAQYWGPPSVYTCAVLQAAVPSEPYGSSLVVEELECPAALVSALGDRAAYAPISEFSG